MVMGLTLFVKVVLVLFLIAWAVISIARVYEWYTEMRFEKDMPGRHDNPKEQIEPLPESIGGVPTVGKIYPGFMRYSDGMIVNNRTGQVFWPNTDGSYTWRDLPFDADFKKVLNKIVEIEKQKNELGKRINFRKGN